MIQIRVRIIFFSSISNFFRKYFSLKIRLYFRNRYFQGSKVQDQGLILVKSQNFETILAFRILPYLEKHTTSNALYFSCHLKNLRHATPLNFLKYDWACGVIIYRWILYKNEYFKRPGLEKSFVKSLDCRSHLLAKRGRKLVNKT